MNIVQANARVTENVSISKLPTPVISLVFSFVINPFSFQKNEIHNNRIVNVFNVFGKVLGI
jgi:putative flippase GtrA